MDELVAPVVHPFLLAAVMALEASGTPPELVYTIATQIRDSYTVDFTKQFVDYALLLFEFSHAEKIAAGGAGSSTAFELSEPDVPLIFRL